MAPGTWRVAITVIIVDVFLHLKALALDDGEKRVDTVGDQSFWDRMYHQRQHRQEIFEWPDLRPFILPRLLLAKVPTTVLMVGCGDSLLGAHLLDDVRERAAVVGVDYSSEAIQVAREIHAANYSEREMSFMQLDIKEIDLQWGSRPLIDVAVDKGTFDCFREDDVAGISKAFRAFDRVLANDGTLYILSHETESGMKHWIQAAKVPWKLHTEILQSRVLEKKDISLARLMRMQLHRFDKEDANSTSKTLPRAPGGVVESFGVQPATALRTLVVLGISATSMMALVKHRWMRNRKVERCHTS